MAHKKTIILILFISWSFCPVYLFAQEEWSLRRQKDGITIYTRAREDDPLKEYRASASIKAPINIVYEFLSDVSLHPEWVYNCVELTIIAEETDRSVTYHTSYDIPWPASDRDLVAKSFIKWKDDSATVHIFTEEISLEYSPDKGVVRMPDYREDVVLEKIDGTNTLFRVEGYADPGGGIPPWLVNMFLVDGIYDSVVRTREFTEKE